MSANKFLNIIRTNLMCIFQDQIQPIRQMEKGALGQLCKAMEGSRKFNMAGCTLETCLLGKSLALGK